MAERWLRARFSPEVCDHHTYVICSDGDLMEGISHEAASLAGHLRLGRLVYVYDDNHISIDGETELALSDDVVERFQGYGWHVDQLGEMANDVDGLEAALRRAAADDEAPSLLVLRSHIGWPSPNFTDTADAHGNPLGVDEVRATKEILGLPPDETFWVPDDVLDLYRAAGRRGREPPRGVGEAPRRRGTATARPTRRASTSGGCPAGRTPCRRGGPATRSPPARPAAPASRRWSTRSRAHGRRRRPHGQHRHGRSRTTACSRPTTRPAARSTSASASTPWAA